MEHLSYWRLILCLFYIVGYSLQSNDADTLIDNGIHSKIDTDVIMDTGNTDTTINSDIHTTIENADSSDGDYSSDSDTSTYTENDTSVDSDIIIASDSETDKEGDTLHASDTKIANKSDIDAGNVIESDHNNMIQYDTLLDADIDTLIDSNIDSIIDINTDNTTGNYVDSTTYGNFEDITDSGIEIETGADNEIQTDSDNEIKADTYIDNASYTNIDNASHNDIDIASYAEIDAQLVADIDDKSDMDKADTEIDTTSYTHIATAFDTDFENASQTDYRLFTQVDGVSKRKIDNIIESDVGHIKDTPIEDSITISNATYNTPIYRKYYIDCALGLIPFNLCHKLPKGPSKNASNAKTNQKPSYFQPIEECIVSNVLSFLSPKSDKHSCAILWRMIHMGDNLLDDAYGAYLTITRSLNNTPCPCVKMIQQANMFRSDSSAEMIDIMNMPLALMTYMDRAVQFPMSIVSQFLAQNRTHSIVPEKEDPRSKNLTPENIKKIIANLNMEASDIF